MAGVLGALLPSYTSAFLYPCDLGKATGRKASPALTPLRAPSLAYEKRALCAKSFNQGPKGLPLRLTPLLWLRATVHSANRTQQEMLGCGTTAIPVTLYGDQDPGHPQSGGRPPHCPTKTELPGWDREPEKRQ